MADLTFQSKWTERISHSLSRLGFAVSLGLLVLPLFFASLLIYWQESKLRTKEIQASLQFLADAKAQQLEQIVTDDVKTLSVLELLLNEKSPPPLFKEIAYRERFSSLSYLTIDAQGHTQCTLSTRSDFIGKTDLLAGEMSEALQGGSYGGFAAIAPESQDKELYIVKKRSPQNGSGATSLFIASRNANTLIETLSENKGLSLFSKKASPFISVNVPEKALTAEAPISHTPLILQLSIPQSALFDTMPSHLLRHLLTLLFFILVLGGFLHIKKAREEKLAKELLEKELNIGKEIQNSLLPKEMPDLPHLDVAGGYLSAKEVGGDLYDFFLKKNPSGTQLLLTMADTSGKGISACLYSLGFRSILRTYAASLDSLSAIVCETNNLFCLDTQDSGMFVTAWTGLYDSKTQELTYHCAGHPPALLVRAEGTIEPLHTEGMALGVTSFQKVSTTKTRLLPGDLLVLYTDGVIETPDAKERLFGQGRLETLLKKHHGSSAKEVVTEVLKAVETFAGKAPQHDDLTLLVIGIVS